VFRFERQVQLAVGCGFGLKAVGSIFSELFTLLLQALSSLLSSLPNKVKTANLQNILCLLHFHLLLADSFSNMIAFCSAFFRL